MKLLLVGLLVVFSLGAFGKCVHDENTLRCAKIKRIIDGDTIVVDVPNLHPFLGLNLPVRIRGIDTAELRSSSECEKRMAQAAKRKLESLLPIGSIVTLKNVKRGKFFRVVADVYKNNISLGAKLLKEKVARKYNKRRQAWCK